jgi:hypothetical protein
VKKRIGLALGAGALLASLSAGGAWASPQGPPPGASGPPVGGCPTGAGWGLVQPTPGHLSAEYDFNGDGWVCRYWLPALDGSSIITFMDNVVR